MSNEWRKAIRTPVSYAILPGVTSSTLLQRQTRFVTSVIVFGTGVLIVLNALLPSKLALSTLNEEHGHEHKQYDCPCLNDELKYNTTYPLTSIETLVDGRIKYQLAVVADLDRDSKITNNKWRSFMIRGELIFNPTSQEVELNWEPSEREIVSEYNSGGRGMELSELVVFNGKLYTCDDRTGIVFEIRFEKTIQVLPWVMLANGNGLNSQAFKCEWMTVVDQHLFVGGLGKEWTTQNGDKILSTDPQWVKRISSSGRVEHIDWHENYIALRSAANIQAPGYLIHEAVAWSDRIKKWIFLPRRASHQAYNDQLDEKRGTNILLYADSRFSTVNQSTKTFGPLIATHGFSSVKLLPLPSWVELDDPRSEIAVALKSEENGDSIATYVTVFRVPDGRILLPEKEFSTKHKYEGVEFV